MPPHIAVESARVFKKSAPLRRTWRLSRNSSTLGRIRCGTLRTHLGLSPRTRNQADPSSITMRLKNSAFVAVYLSRPGMRGRPIPRSRLMSSMSNTRSRVPVARAWLMETGPKRARAYNRNNSPARNGRILLPINPMSVAEKKTETDTEATGARSNCQRYARTRKTRLSQRVERMRRPRSTKRKACTTSAHTTSRTAR